MDKTLLDTDTISYFLRGDKAVAKKLLAYTKNYDKLSISIITYYEICSGLEYKNAYKQLERFKSFVSSKCNILNLDIASIEIAAKTYGYLRRKGITIGTADLFIAGIAISNDLELITNNINHYTNIEHLNISTWKD